MGPWLSMRSQVVVAVCMIAAAISGIVIWRTRVDANPPTLKSGPPVAEVPPVPVAAIAGAAAPAGVPSTTAASSSSADAPTQITITFSTLPPTNASVFWGKKLLGRMAPKKPLLIVRPRDSGPLDVTVSAPGYLPVQTRAHTFGDTNIQVKLTKPEEKPTLFGYRAPLDAGVPLLPADQGTAPPSDLTTPVPR